MNDNPFAQAIQRMLAAGNQKAVMAFTIIGKAIAELSMGVKAQIESTPEEWPQVRRAAYYAMLEAATRHLDYLQNQEEYDSILELLQVGVQVMEDEGTWTHCADPQCEACNERQVLEDGKKKGNVLPFDINRIN